MQGAVCTSLPAIISNFYDWKMMNGHKINVRLWHLLNPGGYMYLKINKSVAVYFHPETI